MEPNISSMSKKIWNIVRVAIFMIKKGLNKKNIFMDFNMMIKRGKIATKALKNLMFHNHHHHNTIHQFFTSRDCNMGRAYAPSYDESREYEFSCSDTPLYTHFLKKIKNHQKNIQYNMHPTLPLEESENINLEDVNNMLEIMLRNEEVISGDNEKCTPSPLLPGLGFGWSPGVRQLRITDSPFPVQNMEDDNKHVDQAAENFIMKFYSQLNKQ